MGTRRGGGAFDVDFFNFWSFIVSSVFQRPKAGSQRVVRHLADIRETAVLLYSRSWSMVLRTRPSGKQRFGGVRRKKLAQPSVA